MKHYFFTILFIINFDFLSAQTNVIEWLNNYNQHSDTTIYYDYKLLNSKQIPDSKINNFKELRQKINLYQLTIFDYNEIQKIIIPEGIMELSNEEFIKNNELKKASLENNKSNDLFIFENNYKPNKNIQLKGRVFDKETNTPILGASIQISSISIGISSDENGEFIINLTKGIYEIEIEYLGYESRSIRAICNGDGFLNLGLNIQPTQLNEIVVTEKGDNFNIRTPIVGLQQLSIRQIKKLPSLMGQVDVIKSLVILAGVNTNAEGLGGINVRGGSSDQNLILQNDVIFYNPNHAIGFLPSFNPDFISKVNLFKGHMPAQYGGRLTSVVSTQTKAGNKSGYKYKLGVGLTNSSLFIEGPIIKDKTSIAVGARIAHANWLIKLINLPDARKSEINFNDYQVKVDHKFNTNSTIGFEYYQSFDDFTLLGETRFQYYNKTPQLYFRQLISKSTLLNFKISKSIYTAKLSDLTFNNISILETGIEDILAKALITSSFKKIELNFGVEYIRHKILPNKKSNITEFVKLTDAENSNEISIFVDTKYDLNEKIQFNFGLRNTRFTALGDRNVFKYKNNIINLDNLESPTFYSKNEKIKSYVVYEPRITASYLISKNASVKLGFNNNHQFLSQISNSLVATPVDFWKSSDLYFKPLSSNNYFIGFYKNFKKDKYESLIELYYSDVKNIQEYKDFSDIIANNHLETEMIFGVGKNYGVEFSLNKNHGKFTYKFNYTYSRSLRKIDEANQSKINDGNWYPSNVDKPHDLGILLNFNYTQNISFNLNFNYSTGRPITVPINRYQDLNANNILYYGNRNEYRIPDYHRLDFSINIFPGYKVNRKIKQSWNISILNIYSRKNPYSIFFRQKQFESLKTFKYSVLGSILPSITLNLEF